MLTSHHLPAPALQVGVDGREAPSACFPQRPGGQCLPSIPQQHPASVNFTIQGGRTSPTTGRQLWPGPQGSAAEQNPMGIRPGAPGARGRDTWASETSHPGTPSPRPLVVSTPDHSLDRHQALKPVLTSLTNVCLEAFLFHPPNRKGRCASMCKFKHVLINPSQVPPPPKKRTQATVQAAPALGATLPGHAAGRRLNTPPAGGRVGPASGQVSTAWALTRVQSGDPRGPAEPTPAGLRRTGHCHPV